MNNDEMRNNFNDWYLQSCLDANEELTAWIAWQAALSQSESVQVSQPVKTFHGHVVSYEPVQITKESWDNACGGLGASK